MFRSELFDAVKKGDAERLNDLIKKGVDLNCQNDMLLTPLHVAAECGYIAIIEILLKGGANINASGDYGMTPLHLASREGHLEVVKILLDRGANVKKVDKGRQTPLHFACSHNHYDVVKLLLKYGANIKALDVNGITPLHDACLGHNPEMVKLLLDEKANLFAVDNWGNTPFEIAINFAAAKRQYEVVNLLLDNSQILISQKLLDAGLNTAVFYNNTDVAKMLLDRPHPANIDAVDKYGNTVLNWAIYSKKLSLVQFLLHRKAKLDSESLTLLSRDMFTQQSTTQPELNTPSFEILLYELATHQNTTSPLIVDLSKRNITDEELGSLSTILKYNKSISKLVLAVNKFSHAGMYKLAEALEVNKTLEVLDLSYNAIGSQYWPSKSGVQYLFSALENNTSLVHLNLDGCSLDKADIRSLINFLKNRKTKNLERIDLDAAVLAKCSKTEQDILQEVNDTEAFLDAAFNVRQLLPKYTEKTWQALQGKLLKDKPSVKELSVDERKLWVAHEMTICLTEYKSQFLAQKDNLTDRNKRYLDALAMRFLECADIISVDDDPDLAAWINEVQQIIHVARPSEIYELTEKIDRQLAISIDEEDPIKIFQKSFENRMIALYSAASGDNSGYTKSNVVTPIEKMGSIAVAAISAIPHFGEIAKSSFELLHFGGHVVDEILENLEIMGKVAEVIEGVVENPLFEHGIHHLKAKVIRKIHGLTEQDKLNNFVSCFTGKSYASKIKSLSMTISFYYHDQLKSLPSKAAEMWARYAYLHVADLLMSGLISGPFKKSLNGEVLGEEAILWLSYVPTRHHAPRVKLKLDKKLMLKEHFMSPKIKFKDSQGIIHTCSTMINDKKDKIIIKTDHYPTRWATQKEIEALNKLWNKLGSNRYCALKSETPANHTLIFDQNDLQELTEKSLPFSTEKAPYKTKSKQIKEQRKTIKELQETNQKMEWRLKNLEDPNRIKAATKILFWYRKEKKNNEVLANIEDKKLIPVARQLMGRKV